MRWSRSQSTGCVSGKRGFCLFLQFLIIIIIILIMSGTFRRSKTDPTLLRMEPVEAKAVDRISKSEILDPEIPKPWIQKSKNLKSGNCDSRKWIPSDSENMKLIIDKYRALPPTVRRRTLSPTAPKKYLPKPKTEHSTQWEQKYLWIVISRIVNSGLW